MNKHILEIAVDAGFCPWGYEDWNPGDAIDWSSRYDSELQNFAGLMVDSCIAELEKVLDSWSEERITTEDDVGLIRGLKTSTFFLRREFLSPTWIRSFN